MLNIRTFIFSGVVVAIFVLTVGLVTARSEIVSDPSSNLASGPEVQEHPVNIIDIYRARSYRSNYDERQEPIASYGSRLDECYDVPVIEIAACRSEVQTLIPSYRSKLDECFDEGLIYRAQCLRKSEKSTP